jgi:short-subunit dehydrogenase
MSKVVLVTGASSGIGLAIATHLSNKGYTVYGASRSAPENKHFHVIKLDVTNNENIIEAVKYILDKSGRVDILVNNAGVGSAGSFEKTPMADIRRSFEVNCFSVIRLSQEVIPIMRAQNYGLIINMSTLGSTIGLPFRAFYSASKGAMDLVTEAIRLEIEKFGIQACTIHPGDVKTNIADHRIVSADYHDETYGKVFKSAFESMNAAMHHGKKPEIFGPMIEKIIKSKNVRRNYYVGSVQERLGHKLKKFLPYYLYERILKMYFMPKY